MISIAVKANLNAAMKRNPSNVIRVYGDKPKLVFVQQTGSTTWYENFDASSEMQMDEMYHYVTEDKCQKSQ